MVSFSATLLVFGLLVNFTEGFVANGRTPFAVFARKSLSKVTLSPSKASLSPVEVESPKGSTGGTDSDEGIDNAANVWKAVATAEPQERDEILKGVAAPNGLRGTYYVNGLASCEIGDRLVHPLESHGFLKALSFQEDGTIHLKAKYIDTPVRKLETFAQRPLFRGAMSAVSNINTLGGSILNALSPMIRPTANLAVRRWGIDNKTKKKKLIVTSDNAPYFSLDPETLETNFGHETFDGVLAGRNMLAHTRVDTERGRLVACAVDYSPFEQATDITFFEFDEAGKLVSERKHRTSPAVIFHDWMITPNYYVIPAAEAKFDLSKLPSLILGRLPATDMFSLDETAPAKVLLIPRHDRNEEVLEAKMNDGTHGVSFHMGPCYEDNDDKIIVNLFVFDGYQFGGETGFSLEEQSFDPTEWSVSIGGPKLQRWTISLNDDRKSASMTTELGSTVVCDMPTFHPDRDGLYSRYVYSLCGIRQEGFFPFNAVAKHDLLTGAMQIWPPEASAHVDEGYEWDGGSSVRAEPLFVPRQGSSGEKEDDGFLLSTVHDAIAGTTTLEIFDAQRFSDGPIQQISLGELWGWNVHSCFEPEK
jgi:carotenoid cleavage dioxygenase-like enzyme